MRFAEAKQQTSPHQSDSEKERREQWLKEKRKRLLEMAEEKKRKKGLEESSANGSEVRHGSNISSRLNLITEMAKTQETLGYIPPEFRPPEDVEEEEKMKGPRKYVPIEEVLASDSNPEELLMEKEEGAEKDGKEIEDTEERPVGIVSWRLSEEEVKGINFSKNPLKIRRNGEKKEAVLSPQWGGQKSIESPARTFGHDARKDYRPRSSKEAKVPKYKTEPEQMRPPREER